MKQPADHSTGSRCNHLGERGSGTVLVVAAVATVLVLTVAGLQVGAAAVAAHRARAAADLAALAGAGALQHGLDHPCGRASDVANLNGAQLVDCRLGAAESVTVRVAAPAAITWPGVPDSAVASARAGPSAVGAEATGSGPTAKGTARSS